MDTRTLAIGGTAAAAAVVVGTLLMLQGFDAGNVACEDIAQARADLQAAYEAGVNASVQVYAGEKAAIDDTLSQCLSAKPEDPCADAQAARDTAVARYNGISSPAENAPHAEFQKYFAQREEAYQAYKSAKDALDACRAANPPKQAVPYEQSDTKACFDAYDAAVASARDVFTENTQALRSALQAAMAALDAREKACNPPGGKDQFTDPTALQVSNGGSVAVELQNCQLLDPNTDMELFLLRRRAAAIPAEIQAVQESIDNVRKRMGTTQAALNDVGTYIPPEAAKTQLESVLNAKRAERKIALEASLEFYNGLLARRQAEKDALEKELADVQAKIAARLAQIQKENAARQRNFPTYVHLAEPDECGYYHCHGVLCGRPDPKQNGCGHGTTTQDDVECKQFIKAYLKAAGVR